MFLENARRCFRHICLVVVFGVSPAAALTNELSVGSCPSRIVVERGGEWADTSNNMEIVEVLRANPGRTNEVAAVYAVGDTSMLEVTVLSLKSLERFQGNIDDDDFASIRAGFADVFRGPSPEMQKRIQVVLEGNLSGTGLAGSHLAYEPAISKPGKFIGFAITEIEVPGVGTTLYETAMKMQHIRGCVVQANFAIAVAPGSRSRLEQAISDFVMR